MIIKARERLTRYAVLLGDYITRGEEALLREAEKFGNKALLHGATITDVIRMHEDSLESLLESFDPKDIIQRSPEFLKHALLPFEQAFQSTTQLEERLHEHMTRLEDTNAQLEAEIKERRQVQDQLYQSQQMLQLVLDNIPQRIFWKDRNFILQGCNQPFALDVGIKHPEDIIGKNDFELSRRETAELNRADDREVMESGIAKLNYEEPQHRADGSFSWLRTSKVPLREENGEVIGILGTYEDITEKKRSDNIQQAIYEISTAANLAKDLPSLFRLVHVTVAELMDARNLFIALFNEATAAVTFPYYVDEFDEAPPEPEYLLPELGKSLTAYMLRHGEPLLLTPEGLEELDKSGEVDLIGTNSKYWLGVPLRIAEKITGALVVQTYTEGVVYTERDRDILAFMSTQIAMAIERKRSDEALGESEAIFRSFFEHSYDGISLVDEKGIIIRWNNAMETATGLRKEQVLGKPLGEIQASVLTNPSERQKRVELFERSYEEFQKTGQAFWLNRPTEVSIQTSEGALHALQQVIFPIQTSKGYRSGVVTRDITNQKTSEETLRQSEERFRKFFELPLIGAAITTADMRWLAVNDRLCSMLGYTQEELMQVSWNSITPPEDFQVEENAYQSVLAGERDGNTFEKRYIRKDGSIIHAYVSAFCVRDTNGGVDYFVSLIQDITERKEAEEQVKRQLQRMAALAAIDNAITSSLDLHDTLQILLEQVTEQLKVDAADVLLFNQQTQTLNYAAGRGFRTDALQYTCLKLGDGYAGRAALERSLIQVPNINEIPDGLTRAPMLSKEGFVTYFGVPLITKGQMKGVLEIFHRSSFDPSGDWRDFLEALAGQAAIAIDNSSLYDGLQKAHSELTLAYDATIEGWARALELRDKETEGHSQRVSSVVVTLARMMGFHENDIAHVRRGALLHDIGKMETPDSILFKPGSLDDFEMEIMRQHPIHAFNLLSPIDFLLPALDIPYSHHEKWDGTGYPRGLKGNEIPFAARIFAIVDVWDALGSDRPYRKAWPQEKIITYLQDQSGIHFDPKVVEVFLDWTQNHLDWEEKTCGQV